MQLFKQVVPGITDELLDEMGINGERRKRLIESVNFQSALRDLILQESPANLYADQETSSPYKYHRSYTGVKDLAEQLEFWKRKGYNVSHAKKYIASLPALPEGAEGWFAILKPSAVLAKHSVMSRNPSKDYCAAVNIVFNMIKESREFYIPSEYEIEPKRVRRHVITENVMQGLETQQKGNILIIPAQFGMRWAGKSVHRARELFACNEFGLDVFTVACMLLTHPNRNVWGDEHTYELYTVCAGDSQSNIYYQDMFCRVSVFYCHERSPLSRGLVAESTLNSNIGPVSGFIVK